MPTLPMRVVSNTSPISNLATIGRLELLREQYGSIAVPDRRDEACSLTSAIFEEP